MRALYFASLMEASATRFYADSPCFSDEHLCHHDETCVPEGQHLYQCCDWSYFTAAHCRQGNPHPCFDKNTCSDGEFCHRLVKPNEETHDFECIDKDDECIGMTMCKKFYQGSCAANNKNKRENIRLAVTSLNDCFAECKNEKKCKGFDLDSKGGCILAFQDCRPEELVLHPIFDNDDDLTNHEWQLQHFYNKYQDKKQLSYTYYPMSGCSTPERSEDCDKTLVNHIEDLYLHFLAQMKKKSADEEQEKEATADYRKKGRF